MADVDAFETTAIFISEYQFIKGTGMIVSILIFLIMFSVIVVSHEFGHFAVARRNEIRVNEFDIGMGPVLYRKPGKETDLCIRLLPIGGACLFDGMDGLDDEDEEGEKRVLDEHAFPNAPVGARIAAVLAGPMANFLLGFLFSIILFIVLAHY